MDTMFSFDSAAAEAVVDAENLSFTANHWPPSTATRGGASSSSDTDDDDHNAARKKPKLNHPAFDAAATPLQAFPYFDALPRTGNVGTVSAASTSVESTAECPSLLLQPRPLQHPNYDDLYTDEDDDDLVSYRASIPHNFRATSVSATG